MTTIIKNGSVVAADVTTKADVRTKGGVITEIGQGLKGGTELDATGNSLMVVASDLHRRPAAP